MNDEELKKIQNGDEVKIRMEVLRTPTTQQDDFYLQLRNTKFYVSPDTLKELGEYVRRRKFKRGDLVRWRNAEFILQKDENDKGQVPLNLPVSPELYNHEFYAKANEVQLLMSVQELKEINPQNKYNNEDAN